MPLSPQTIKLENALVFTLAWRSKVLPLGTVYKKKNIAWETHHKYYRKYFK